MITQSEDRPNRAASPIIAVILMVAISVILAATIGTFVMGVSNVQENGKAGAAVTFDTTDHQIQVIWINDQNADFLWVNTTGMSTQQGQHKLGTVGATLTMKTGSGDDTLDTSLSNTRTEQDAEFSHGDSITVTVKAVKEDRSTVIVSKTKEI